MLPTPGYLRSSSSHRWLCRSRRRFSQAQLITTIEAAEPTSHGTGLGAHDGPIGISGGWTLSSFKLHPSFVALRTKPTSLSCCPTLADLLFPHLSPVNLRALFYLPYHIPLNIPREIHRTLARILPGVCRPSVKPALLPRCLGVDYKTLASVNEVCSHAVVGGISFNRIAGRATATWKELIVLRSRSSLPSSMRCDHPERDTFSTLPSRHRITRALTHWHVIQDPNVLQHPSPLLFSALLFSHRPPHHVLAPAFFALCLVLVRAMDSFVRVEFASRKFCPLRAATSGNAATPAGVHVLPGFAARPLQSVPPTIMANLKAYIFNPHLTWIDVPALRNAQAMTAAMMMFTEVIAVRILSPRSPLSDAPCSSATATRVSCSRPASSSLPGTEWGNMIVAKCFA